MSREEGIHLIIEAEFPSVLLENWEILSGHEQGQSWEEAALQTLIARGERAGPEEQSALAAACKRLRQLQKKTDKAILRVAQDAKLKLPAIEEEKLRLREKELFHGPAIAADFGQFKRLAYWDMHEAACLLLGRDPRRLEGTVISGAPAGSPFAAEFRELTAILTRAAEAGRRPNRKLNWRTKYASSKIH